MKIDLFNEIQNPRPRLEGHEQRRFREAIEQAKLADDLGYGCWWQVEHHGADEFSLSSAPELLLAAISQQTSRIRLGHSAVLSPGKFNHPIRVAERAATLDHLSGGRVELGLTRSTSPEWRLFDVDPDDVRSQTQEAFEMLPGMWTSERFPTRAPITGSTTCRSPRNRCSGRIRRCGRPQLAPDRSKRRASAASASWARRCGSRSTARAG